MSKPKRVLVAGGAGFLGSHLCDALAAAGNHVICLDNFLTATRDNIHHLIGTPHFELLDRDVTLPVEIDVDEIYNFACPASPIHYQRDPVQTTRTSVMGAINLLDLATARGAKILQASTSEVYGDPLVHPQTEDYWGNVNPTGVRACYNEAKRCAETLFFDYWRQHQTSIRIARIFNTYGPRMRADDGRVVSAFIVQALTGKDIVIFGDGLQTRSFCHVDDLVSGCRILMDAPDRLSVPVNLGNPQECTVLDLAKKILSLTNSASRIVHVPLPEDDPKRRCPDITRAKIELGWTPRISLDEGLKETIAYFDRFLTAGVRGIAAS